MSDNGSIKVGVFGDGTGPTGKLVPKMYQGKQVWFSTKHNFFVIVDDENKPIKPFNFKQFEKFIDADVIVFTNPSVKMHMENLLSEYNSAGQLFSQVDEDGIAVSGSEPAYHDESPSDPLWSTGDPNATQLFSGPAEHDEGDYYDEDSEYDYERNLRRGEIVDSNMSEVKDPTRHMLAFFIVTLILAIVAFIVIRFGKPIIQALTPFLT